MQWFVVFDRVYFDREGVPRAVHASLGIRQIDLPRARSFLVPIRHCHIRPSGNILLTNTTISIKMYLEKIVFLKNYGSTIAMPFGHT